MTAERSITTDASRGEAFRFAVHVLRGRWFALFASFLIMAVAGVTFLFGVYSEAIKSSLGYDQTTLNLLAFFNDLGASIGIFAGLIAEVTPTWFVLLIGSVMNFGAYFMAWLAVNGKLSDPTVWQMCMYICIGATSQNFANTAVLVTSVSNFPERRAITLGLLKGFSGLCGAIMTQIYMAIYGNDSKSLILLVGWLPAAISVVFMFTIRPVKVVRQPNEVRLFYHFLFVSMGLALFLLAITVVENSVAFPRAGYASSVTVVCAILFVPLFIAIRQELVFWNQIQNPTSPNSQTSEPELEPEPEPEPEEKHETSWFQDIFMKKPERGEDYTILQALLSTDMLILLFATFCGFGTSLTSIGNLGQIGMSLGYPTKTTKTFVSILNIWSYFGRIFSGFASETLLAKYNFPRPLMTTFVLFLSCIGFLLIAFAIPGSLYIASIIIGFSFGAQLPLIFAIISDLFGLKYYSTLLNCGQLAAPLGSYIFNVKITGPLYDTEALKDLKRKGMNRSSVKELTCIGVDCYRLAFLILAGVAFLGALASLILVVRTREFYKGDIYKKFKERAEESAAEVDSDSVIEGNA